MFLIDTDSAEAYLRGSGRLTPGEQIEVRRLAGGVSNEVLYVRRCDPPGAASGKQESGPDDDTRQKCLPERDFVLKQARPQLRVADPWFCSIERIWREVETLRVCGAALAKAAASNPKDRSCGGLEPNGNADPIATVPLLLFEDRENFAFAMSAAPPHEVWKQRLLAGQTEPVIAAACGRLLAAIHAGTWRDAEVARRLDDRSFFNDLRVDPYYHRIAELHADLAPAITNLIQSLSDHRLCLVHGDFSPKNLLVSCAPPLGLMLVDFEVGHFGDPAFDLGFIVSHLTLKAFWSGGRFDEYFQLTEVFWDSYLDSIRNVATPEEVSTLVARGIRNFAACMLARIDGKSKVEYLSDESLRNLVRTHARSFIFDPPPTWEAVRERIASR